MCICLAGCPSASASSLGAIAPVLELPIRCSTHFLTAADRRTIRLADNVFAWHMQAAPERRRRARPHMVTLVARSPNLVGSSSWGSLHHQLSISPTASGQPAGQTCGMSQAPPSQTQPQPAPARKVTRNDILEAFIANLRHRESIDLDAPGVLHGIREHFQRLPTRYALDVNISTLDVLNHKRWVFICAARREVKATVHRLQESEFSLCIRRL